MGKSSNSSRRRPRQSRSKQTVEDILEATAQVLKREGIDRTTTDRIAARAGVSVGSVYQYFPNKVALYSALTERHFERLAEAVSGAVARMPEVGPEGFPATIVEVLLRVEQHDSALGGALHKIAVNTPAIGAMLDAEARKYEEFFCQLIAAKVLLLGWERARDPLLVARLMTRALSGVMRRTLAVEPEIVHTEEFAAELYHLIAAYLQIGPVQPPDGKT